MRSHQPRNHQGLQRAPRMSVMRFALLPARTLGSSESTILRHFGWIGIARHSYRKSACASSPVFAAGYEVRSDIRWSCVEFSFEPSRPTGWRGRISYSQPLRRNCMYRVVQMATMTPITR